MRCKTCDYPLWNLKTRQCPECGSVFAVADYEFVINSVRFCCPHCDQAYYGTGAKGHLVPEEFNCVTCANRVRLNDMVLRPAEGVDEAQTRVESMPWLERRERGFLKSWFATVGKSMTIPNRLMRAVPQESSLGQAWWYATVTCLLVFSAGAGLPLAGIGLVLLATGDSDALGMFGAAAGFVVGGTITMLIVVGIWGALAHGILKITGGAASPIGKTYEALLYSVGTCSPAAIPFVGPYCGFYLLWIWWVVSGTIMVKESQRVHGGRATLAVLSLPGIFMVLGMAAYGFFIYAMMTSVGAARSAAMVAATQNSEVGVLAQSLQAHVAASGGKWPAHAAELVIGQQGLGVSNFISSDTTTIEDDVPIADTTLAELELLPTNKKRNAVKAAAEALPPNTIAHRLGDFVFTYHGIDPATANPSLWAVIWSPDPDSVMDDPDGAFPPGAGPAVTVGLVDGTARTLTESIWAALVRQNALRSASGLPPLPDPATVTHDEPATSSP